MLTCYEAGSAQPFCRLFFCPPNKAGRGITSTLRLCGLHNSKCTNDVGTRHPRSRYEELWVRVMDVSKCSAQMTQSQETA